MISALNMMQIKVAIKTVGGQVSVDNLYNVDIKSAQIPFCNFCQSPQITDFSSQLLIDTTYKESLINRRISNKYSCGTFQAIPQNDCMIWIQMMTDVTMFSKASKNICVFTIHSSVFLLLTV